MADETKFTQADIDKAVTAAMAKLMESVDALEAKNVELIAEVRTAKQKARAASEIKPEDMAALEADNEKLRADLVVANKAAKEATTAAEKATKALETEQGAARSYALDAEIATAIAAGNIVPALVPAFTAMVKQQAKADLVDGKYQVTIGDKAAKDHITTFLGTEEGKAFKAASINGGGGAPGGKDSASGGKTMTREAFDAIDGPAKVAFAKEGGKVVDATA